MNPDQQKPRLERTVLWLAGTVVVLALCIAVSAGIFWYTHRSSADADGQAQSQKVIDAVSTLYLTPSDEVPTVAKIQDVSKLASEQPFYAKAQDGDYLVVYRQAKVALIYRQPVNKLVAVSPVSTETGPAQK